jgi:anti-sigma factor RsiW
MQHVKDIDLIELTAGHLDRATAETVAAHVEACPDCRRKLEQLRRTWDVLGSWSVEVPSGLTPARSFPESRVIRARGYRTVLRIAASVAIAAILGYAGGRWTSKPARAAVPADAPAYLSALNPQAGDGLAWLVLSEVSPSGKGG